MEKRNLLHIECIRIIAAFFVIFNHTSVRGYFLFASCPRGSKSYWVYMFLSVLCKIAVPLFFMITGALLLKKDISLKQLWRQRISRIILTILVFSLVLYVFSSFPEVDSNLSPGGFFSGLYTRKIHFSYWYLYAYVSLLITLPFLRAIVKGLSEKNYIYLIVLAFVFMAVIPCGEYLLFQGEIKLYKWARIRWLMSDIVIWPLLGYYLENVADIQKWGKKHVLGSFVLGISGIMATCLMTYYVHVVTGQNSPDVLQKFYFSFILLPCTAVYLGGKYFFATHTLPEKVKKGISSVGSCTFGIYLLHIFIKDSKYMKTFWDTLCNRWNWNAMIAALTVSAVTMTIGYIMTLILKRIPGIKKLL